MICFDTGTPINKTGPTIYRPEDDGPRVKCVEYDGEDLIQARPKTNRMHGGACLALLDEKPITVGSSISSGPNSGNSVEQLNGTSWISLKEFPADICHHSCLGMDDFLLVFGGSAAEPQDDWKKSEKVYMFQKSNWIIVGNLSQKVEKCLFR